MKAEQGGVLSLEMSDRRDFPLGLPRPRGRSDEVEAERESLAGDSTVPEPRARLRVLLSFSGDSTAETN